jgi:hypothetical protein
MSEAEKKEEEKKKQKEKDYCNDNSTQIMIEETAKDNNGN